MDRPARTFKTKINVTEKKQQMRGCKERKGIKATSDWCLQKLFEQQGSHSPKR